MPFVLKPLYFVFIINAYRLPLIKTYSSKVQTVRFLLYIHHLLTAIMNLQERIFILPLIKVSFNTYVFIIPVKIETTTFNIFKTNLISVSSNPCKFPPFRKTAEINAENQQSLLFHHRLLYSPH